MQQNTSSLKRPPALLALVLSAFLLAGCGGGNEATLIEQLAEETKARTAVEGRLKSVEAELSVVRKTLSAAQDESGKLATQKVSWQAGTFAASAGAIILLLVGAALGSSARSSARRGNRSN